MVDSPRKRPSIPELKQQLAETLQSLEIDNAWLKMGKIIEQQPVAEKIDRLAEIMEQLMARGEKIKMDIRKWDPRLLHELRLNEVIGPKIEQIEMKEALLKKHRQAGKRIPAKPKRRTRRRLPG